jgi:hypothetical protein
MASVPSTRPAPSISQVSPLPPLDVLPQRDFLARFGHALAERVAAASPPVYRGPADALWAPLSLLTRKPLGAQGLIAQAGACAVRGLCPSRHTRAGHPSHTDASMSRKRRRGLGLVAEMATGKSYLSLAMLGLADEEVTRQRAPDNQRPEKAHFFPAVVLSPPIVVEKWAREAASTLPTARPVVIRPLRTKSDVAAFRRFDPTFTGSRLSAIGCIERVARRIRQELAAWREQRDRAIKDGRTPSRKPCHVAILSTSVAKLGPAWTPVYLLRVLRDADGDGRVHALRDPATGEPYVVPCCPRCFQPLKYEAHAERREHDREKRRRRVEQRGPRGMPHSEDGDGGDDDEEALAVYLTEAELLGQRGPAAKRACAACGEPLWQVAPDNAHWRALPPPLAGHSPVRPLPLPDRDRHGHQTRCVTSTFERRYPLADYLRKRHRGLFRSLICDEAHQFKGAGTAQGFAAASLVDACDPGGTTLFLTGTLFSGYCSDLYPMLWRLLPELRTTFGYGDLKRWVDLYGVRQKVVKVREGRPGQRGDGSRSKRREDRPVVKELPGISPLVLRYLLDSCLFLELADVAPGLPPYSEEVLVVPLGEPLGSVYTAFERETTAALKQMLARYDNSGLAAWFQGLMIQPNLPWRGMMVASPSGEVLGSAPPLPDKVIYPKERALLDLARRERAAGRRMLVYCEHTGAYDLLPRLKALLEADDAAWRQEAREQEVGVQGARQWEANEAADAPLAGGDGTEALCPPAQRIRVAILRSSTVSTAEREAWLQRTVEQGCDVLLCLSGLVEVGLDLLAFPTIVCDEVIFSTTRVRQAIRRSYRPGQSLPVKVVQLAYDRSYDRSMEVHGLQLIASKIKSSLMVEGKLPGEGIAAFGQSSDDQGNLLLELARSVLADAEGGARDVAGSLEVTFRELAATEHEQDGYIGDVELPTVLDDAEETQDPRDRDAEGTHDAPHVAAAATSGGDQVVAMQREAAGAGVASVLPQHTNHADNDNLSPVPAAFTMPPAPRDHSVPSPTDPWARWRALQRQMLPARRCARLTPAPSTGGAGAARAAAGHGGSLWATPMTTSEAAGSPREHPEASPGIGGQPAQATLWDIE